MVKRVKDIENQNRFLRRQLSISQTQLMKSAINNKQTKLRKQNHRRRLSSDNNNHLNSNYYYGANGDGEDNDSVGDNDNNIEEPFDKDKIPSRCAVSTIP